MLDSRASAVVILVEHQVKITPGFIDVIQQKIGGDYVPTTIPLGVQFSEKGCRYRIDNARPNHMGIERSRGERDPIELIPRFDEHVRTRIEIRSTFKSAFISIEESAKIQAKITGDFLSTIGKNTDSILIEMVFTRRDDESLMYLEILVETFHDPLCPKLQPVVTFKIDPIGERKYSGNQFALRIKEQANLRPRDDAADTQNSGPRGVAHIGAETTDTLSMDETHLGIKVLADVHICPLQHKSVIAATAEEHRGKGGQNALIKARLNRAAELGCQIACSQTLTMLKTSLGNLEHNGFEIVYKKQVFVWES